MTTQQQSLQSFINQLHRGLPNPDGFNGEEAVVFLIDNNICSTHQEAVFTMQLLVGNKVVIRKDSMHSNNNEFDDEATYYFSKYYHATPTNSYWFNFILAFNKDTSHKLNLQPSAPALFQQSNKKSV